MYGELTQISGTAFLTTWFVAKVEIAYDHS